MNTASAPIIATTSLSVLLHGVVAVALLAGYAHTNSNEAVGQGLEIELISSITVAEQHEADVPRSQQVAERNNLNAANPEKKIKTGHTKILASLRSDKVFTAIDDYDVQQYDGVLNEERSIIQNTDINDSNVSVLQSTDASHNRHSILELLHSSISNNKKYPYLAQRQRREGITTVSFVLNPDGTIESTRLINSSQTGSLDRAALSAVKGIEPFTVAKEYLDKSEEFRIDVVFDLL
jgi:TonB family protein